MQGEIENEAYLSDSCKKLQFPGISIYHQRIITKCDRTFSFFKALKIKMLWTINKRNKIFNLFLTFDFTCSQFDTVDVC